MVERIEGYSLRGGSYTRIEVLVRDIGRHFEPMGLVDRRLNPIRSPKLNLGHA